jgi:tRNA-binding EMAP/Myf-like protein
VECSPHPDSDELYIQKIDLGEATQRDNISNCRKFISADEMKTGRIVVLTNVKERNVRGYNSQGIVFSAKNSEGTKIELLRPPKDAPIGERIFPENFTNKTYEAPTNFPSQKQMSKFIGLMSVDGDS